MERNDQSCSAGAMPRICGAALGAAALALAQWPATPAQAAEGGHGVYLLGSKSTMAGILAQPGLYFNNDTYFYFGSAGTSRQLPVGGQIRADLDVETYVDIMALMYVLPQEVLGGNLGFSVSLPVGYQDISARAVLSGTTLGTEASDTLLTFGDPIVGATLGWHNGNMHWTTGALLNIPVGDYRDDGLANIAYHHWALDVNGAVTWLDRTTGWEASAMAGLTFNAENPDTDYRTGTEFHLDASLTRAFSQKFSAGVVGYYYNQLTGDGGDGATLGDFKGRVAALGGTMTYNFMMGETPASLRLKVFREFDVKNRLEATTGFLTISFPL